jgi:hypothetical protein
MGFMVNKLSTYCRFIGVPILVSFVTRMFMAGRYYYYYYYYCHSNKLLKPEHEYKRLESNSVLVWKIFRPFIKLEK